MRWSFTWSHNGGVQVSLPCKNKFLSLSLPLSMVCHTLLHRTRASFLHCLPTNSAGSSRWCCGRNDDGQSCTPAPSLPDDSTKCLGSRCLRARHFRLSLCGSPFKELLPVEFDLWAANWRLHDHGQLAVAARGHWILGRAANQLHGLLAVESTWRPAAPQLCLVRIRLRQQLDFVES